MRTANEHVRTLADWYCESVGMPAPIEGHYVEVDIERHKRIAATYEGLPTHDCSELTRDAYTALSREVEAQYTLVSAYYTIIPTTDDPYPGSEAMMKDVAENKRLYVFSGSDTPHPYLETMTRYGVSVNVLFRAVHDLFGHAAEGYQFGMRGEENAWVHHSMMFTPLARYALTTETRGQNAWFHYGPYGHLPVKERPFAIQKAAVLPSEYVMLPRLRG